MAVGALVVGITSSTQPASGGGFETLNDLTTERMCFGYA
jgi:hypothetical protein